MSEWIRIVGWESSINFSKVKEIVLEVDEEVGNTSCVHIYFDDSYKSLKFENFEEAEYVFAEINKLLGCKCIEEFFDLTQFIKSQRNAEDYKETND